MYIDLLGLRSVAQLAVAKYPVQEEEDLASDTSESSASYEDKRAGGISSRGKHLFGSPALTTFRFDSRSNRDLIHHSGDEGDDDGF